MLRVIVGIAILVGVIVTVTLVSINFTKHDEPANVTVTVPIAAPRAPNVTVPVNVAAARVPESRAPVVNMTVPEQLPPIVNIINNVDMVE
jgi:hypothetical protein